MSASSGGAVLRFRNKAHVVRADFALVREIEQELGGIAALAERFGGTGWEIVELVTLIHMLLQAAGESVDYLHLGNQMLREGLRPYLAAAQSFLQSVLDPA